jgi:hypothetical protein
MNLNPLWRALQAVAYVMCGLFTPLPLHLLLSPSPRAHPSLTPAHPRLPWLCSSEC